MPKTVYTLRDVIELIAKQEKEDPCKGVTGSYTPLSAIRFHEIKLLEKMFKNQLYRQTRTSL
jgi:hypothetical protein